MDKVNESMKEKTLEGLRDYLSGSNPTTQVAHYANVEFLYRQSLFIKRQTLAIENQSKAAEDTYKTMRKNSRIMLWTLIFIAISSISTLIIALSS